MNQDELIEKIGVLLTGWTLDKKHAAELYAIVLPYIVVSGLNLNKEEENGKRI